MPEFREVVRGFQTVEGPTVTADGVLYFSDVRGGGVYALGPGKSVEVVVPKRKGVGGLCLHAHGGVVVSGRDITHVQDGQSRTLLTRDEVPAGDGTFVGGFNDIGAGPDGRIYAGVQRFTAPGEYGPGALVAITAEHEFELLYSGLLPNGNAVAPDSGELFQVDSTGQRVLVFDLAGKAPSMTAEFSTAALPGVPDGCAFDETGALWIAFHHGGCVARFDRHGTLLDRIDFPTPTVTSLCFGPPPTHELYVVTDDETDSPEPRGCIYQLDVGVGGAPVYAATV
ncbi:MAG TPA: SMP-30/gluconolactonase/LRE family protein [Mycobacteriales bacterium]|nr:SMP-30/gluconolactonase/LRE family protein [Mycobacteriales bacterium]